MAAITKSNVILTIGDESNSMWDLMSHDLSHLAQHYREQATKYQAKGQHRDADAMLDNLHRIEGILAAVT